MLGPSLRLKKKLNYPPGVIATCNDVRLKPKQLLQSTGKFWEKHFRETLHVVVCGNSAIADLLSLNSAKLTLMQ